MDIINRLKVFNEFKGPKGDKGDKGDPGNSEEVSNILALDNAFISKLGTNIVSNSTELANSVSSSVVSNDTVKSQISNTIKNNTDFQKSIANLLTTDNVYKNRITGPPGTIADETSLANSLKDKTLWCADGDWCTIPSGKKGIKLGGLS